MVLNGLKKLNERFIKDYHENSKKGYFLEADFEYPKKLFNLHSDLSFLSEGKKIKKRNKLVCNIHNKENCVVHIRALKQSSNHGLILKKVYKIIHFNKEEWLKPYLDMNTKLRKEAKMILKKILLN